VDPGRISFEDPWAALVGLVGVLPLAAALLSHRRSRQVARAVGLAPTPVGVTPATAAALIACLALAVAAARPVLEEGTRTMRADSEVVFVVDVTRSMLASASAGAPTRLEQARAAVLRLRAAVPDVPAGVSGITDRVLPYSFPTPDRAAFADVIAHSVELEAPPPHLGGLTVVATSLEALTQLDRGFFSDGIDRRACVVVTDGESRSFTQTPERRTCRFFFVQVGGTGDRIFGSERGFDAGYRPDPAARATLERIAAATGGRVWPVARVGDAASALREVVETGPTTGVPASSEPRSLAHVPAGLALALTAAVAIGALRRRRASSGAASPPALRSR
jgi:hypothetical protein